MSGELVTKTLAEIPVPTLRLEYKKADSTGLQEILVDVLGFYDEKVLSEWTEY